MKEALDTGWQTTLADLCLILFMLMAAVTSEQKAPSPAQSASPAQPVPPRPRPAPVRAEPVAVYRPTADAPSLTDWLDAQGRDSRQRLTIVVPYAPGGEGGALDRAKALVRQAGVPARIIVEPGNPASAYVSLTFDVAQAFDVAQDLQTPAPKPSGMKPGRN